MLHYHPCEFEGNIRKGSFVLFQTYEIFSQDLFIAPKPEIFIVGDDFNAKKLR